MVEPKGGAAAADGVHAGLPGGELAVGVEDGVGNPGEDHAGGKVPTTAKKGRTIPRRRLPLTSKERVTGVAGRTVLRGGGEVGEGDGEDLDGGFE